MKIIVVGVGKSGFSVAETLTREGHSVTVIDRQGSVINGVSNFLDVICVEGSATNPETLMEAGAASADLLVAATRDDEANMVCGISARKLGTKNVIARVRDPEYLSQSGFLREALGLSVIVNPEYECAKEISRMLRFPGAARVDSFSKSSVEIVEYRIGADDTLDGLQLRQLPGKIKAKVLVSVVERGGEAHIPNGEFVLSNGDRLSIAGAPNELRRFFAEVGRYKKPVKSVLIMGGGRIAVYLTKLLAECGIAATVIEQNRARCDELCDLLPGTAVVCGDATRREVLEEEGLGSVDAFVALTGDDGDNIITSLYAKNRNVDTIVTKVNRGHYNEILESSGLDRIVSPRVLLSAQMAMFARAMDNARGASMEALYKLADGKAEALEFKVGGDSACIGVSLRELKLKAGILICSVIRGSRSFIPDGSTCLMEGDHAIIVAPAGQIKKFDSILEGHA